MKNVLQQLLEKAKSELSQKLDTDELFRLEKKYLGRKGELADIMKKLKSLSDEEKKEVGLFANQVKQEIRQLFDALKQKQGEAAGENLFDITLPGVEPAAGTLHPISRMIIELNEAFLSLGFEVYEGPEITSELLAFDNLNFPPHHPARETMDTYWLAGSDDKKGAHRLCLRPHLTGGSIRYMQAHTPPFRFVYPGRVFRSEATDASHERTFYQYEALIVDQQVPFSSGRVMVNAILERVFGRQVKTRMRAGFFPFVEPGFEIDMQCLLCAGKGCSVCGQVGWVEMMPGGPPHPNVLKAAGVDPAAWQGFYINIGLDRLVMMKYGVDDIRLFHSGDLTFLRQF